MPIKRSHLFIAGGAALFIAAAAGSSSGQKPGNDLPRSVASIEKAGNMCAAYGLSEIRITDHRYLGHVVLRIPECQGKPESVELVGAGNVSAGVLVTGEELAVDCVGRGAEAGELAVAAVLTPEEGHRVDVTSYQGTLPEVVLGPAALTQLNIDGVLHNQASAC